MQRPRPPGRHDGVGRGMNDGTVHRAPAVSGGRHFSFEGLGSAGRSCAKDWLETQEGLSVLWGV